MATGRTVSKFVNFNCDDSNGTLRTIPVSSINGVGLDYPEAELTAFQDAMKGALPETPDCTISIEGPFDTTAAQTAGTLSGSHTILSAIVGGVTPLSLDAQFGIRAAWGGGNPQFGISAGAIDGFLCTAYEVNVDTMTYSAEFKCFPGSAAPAWGIAAET